MTQFEKAIQEPVTCDICGEVMHPMYGGGWDNDRIVCADRDCGAEIEYPTSTPVDMPEKATETAQEAPNGTQDG